MRRLLWSCRKSVGQAGRWGNAGNMFILFVVIKTADFGRYSIQVKNYSPPKLRHVNTIKIVKDVFSDIMTWTFKFVHTVGCIIIDDVTDAIVDKIQGPTIFSDKVSKVNIDLPNKKVFVTSSVLSAEELTETLKKTGKEVTYVGSKDAWTDISAVRKASSHTACSSDKRIYTVGIILFCILHRVILTTNTKRLVPFKCILV